MSNSSGTIWLFHLWQKSAIHIFVGLFLESLFCSIRPRDCAASRNYVWPKNKGVNEWDSELLVLKESYWPNVEKTTPHCYTRERKRFRRGSNSVKLCVNGRHTGHSWLLTWTVVAQCGAEWGRRKEAERGAVGPWAEGCSYALNSDQGPEEELRLLLSSPWGILFIASIARFGHLSVLSQSNWAPGRQTPGLMRL